jgi:hypothetical protein
LQTTIPRNASPFDHSPARSKEVPIGHSEHSLHASNETLKSVQLIRVGLEFHFLPAGATIGYRRPQTSFFSRGPSLLELRMGLTTIPSVRLPFLKKMAADLEHPSLNDRRSLKKWDHRKSVAKISPLEGFSRSSIEPSNTEVPPPALAP